MFGNGICSQFRIVGELDIQGVILSTVKSYLITTMPKVTLVTSSVSTGRLVKFSNR